MNGLISQLIKAEAYGFKEPWRATNNSLTIVVPIVAKMPRRREYVVLEEVKDKVKILDTGGIDKARIEGYVDKPTFIRGGTMLKGATQERATQFSIVMMPQKSEQIPVYCIHASKGIRPGSSFLTIGHVPQLVHAKMLVATNQSHTWSAISEYSRRASQALTPAAMAVSRMPSDDLVGVYETIHKFREDLKEILKQIPEYVNQVGTAIIDPDGVLGLEMYDHPDSWKAFSESIMRSYAEALAKEDKTGIFKLDMEAIIPLIRTFLKEVEEAEEEEVFNKNNARTVILKAEGFVGEYTDLKGKTIHLLITRCKKEVARKPESPIHQPQPRTTTPAETAMSPMLYYTISCPSPISEVVTDWLKTWKRGIQVLTALEKPKTWTALKKEVRVSKATLAARIKELQRIGAVDKHRNENGVVRYSLTGIGHELLKKKSHC